MPIRTFFFNACCTLGLVLLGLAAVAQTGRIRGFVYEKGSGEPVIFTNVYLQGTSHGASTDENGFYAISQVPPGDYTLMVTYLGYDTLREPVTVKKGAILDKKLYLEKGEVQMKEVEVRGERTENKKNVRMSVEKITPKQIQQLPTVGGEADIAQYLQVLPGVVFTGDQGGQLYIRGGSPVQNKVLLDGMVIYNPFHSIGLFSVFDTDIIRNADIYTGGFNAEYGGRISSVMDITTRDGNKKRVGGKVSVSPFVAKALVEGPIIKQKEDGGASSSYILSAKNSYLEQTSQALYTPIDGVDSSGLPFNFTDLYAKTSFNGRNGSKLNLFGFRHQDRVNDYKAVSDLEWLSYGGGANYVIVPPGSPVLIEGDLAYSQYNITFEEESEDPEEKNIRSSGVNSFNMGLDFKYFVGDNDLRYGINMLGNSTDFQFYNEVGRSIEEQDNNTELAGYITYKWNKGLFVIEPSFRMHYYASLSTMSPEPRLGVKFNAHEKFRIKAATGIYSQSLVSSVSNRDVVNLFYGFLTAPENLPENFTTREGEVREVTNSLQKANHYILGFEYDLTRKLDLNVEGYFKDFRQLTNLNRNKLFEDNAQNADKPDLLKKDFIIETGHAMGVDVVLEYNSEHLRLWGVYSLGKVDRWDGEQVYAPIFDRRHSVNLVATYRWGEDDQWEANARWNYGSGFPFTRIQGHYEKFTFRGGAGTNYASGNGQLGTAYESINQGRLPDYHRLDVNLKRKFDLGKHTKLEANAGVTNAYDRNNIFYYDGIRKERVNQLPVLPSIGLSLRF